ncbi:Kinetochore protein Spc24 [Friedmanniomyces endolithicus]|nr:Kinetochore protein Spc24 [Friedmanniomyces endolithicus]
MADSERPAKRAKILDAITSDSDVSADEGVPLPTADPTDFKIQINHEFAKRFEHNEKRKEKVRLEEKYGPTDGKRSRGDEREDEEGSGEASTDESEDDDADLADLDVDKEIHDTLQALKNKDPRIYDPESKFYNDWEAAASAANGKARQEKPMYLHDYHRRNLLAGYAGGEDEEMADTPTTYQQEQDDLKRTLVGSMHQASAAQDPAAPNDDDEEEEEEEDFLVKKPKSQPATIGNNDPPKRHITESDVATADKDPETFLSNFMAARAWIAPSQDGPGFAPLDEDDSEEERKADKFEEAWNLRFEDPAKANETLMSYQRDLRKFGVRRDEVTGRQRAREREKEKKEAERKEREEERALLRKLRIEEAEEKVQRIRVAAGLRGKDVDLTEWRDVIEGEFDDEQWDREMRARFGEKYYAEDDGESGMEGEGHAGGKKYKAKKPKWDDDIDIKDLVPEFDDEEREPEFTLSDEEDEAAGGAPLLDEVEANHDHNEVESDDGDVNSAAKPKRKSKKDHQQDKAASKRAARLQRAAIESLVDTNLPIAHPTVAANTKKPVAGFRYRATSPTRFGLSARDILFADDAALNQFVGLKKMHSWRDLEKKRRDKKRFSKKARVKEWRREVFGREEGAEGKKFVGGGEDGAQSGERAGVEVVGGSRGEDGGVRDGERRKKKRKRIGRQGKREGGVES